MLSRWISKGRGSVVVIHPYSFVFWFVWHVQETMQFEKGFMQVTQPVNAVVGIERRTAQ